jgi:hypothetical protein
MKPEPELSLDELLNVVGGMNIEGAPRSVNVIDLPTNLSIDPSNQGYYFDSFSSAGDPNMSNADGSAGYSDGTAQGWGSVNGYSY